MYFSRSLDKGTVNFSHFMIRSISYCRSKLIALILLWVDVLTEEVIRKVKQVIDHNMMNILKKLILFTGNLDWSILMFRHLLFVILVLFLAHTHLLSDWLTKSMIAGSKTFATTQKCTSNLSKTFTFYHGLEVKVILFHNL